jgi:hypothetical protein
MKPPLLLGILSLLIAGSFETAAAQESDIGWPREIDHAGHAIVLYQPQLESFEGDRLTARAAVSVTPGGSDQMVFGAVWIDAYVETDRDSRTVTVMNVDIPRVRFPNADADQERQLAEILVQDLETQDLVISLDRILAGLDLVERERTAAEGLATEPPNILFTTEPSILVVLDGKPVLHDIDDTNLQRIVNTPYTIVFDQDPWGYYLYAGEESWLTATDVMGPWELADQVPADVAALVPPDSGGVEAEPEDAETESEPVNLGDLRVVVVTEPTELIISAGPPSYASIAGTDLIYVSNTESDVFLNIETQEYYIVLTGRWYKSESLDGPWSYVASDSLPDDFAKIPPESARGSVLVYVAGTDEARDAVLDNAIPETSAVRRWRATVPADRGHRHEVRGEYRVPGPRDRGEILRLLSRCLVRGRRPERALRGGDGRPGRGSGDSAGEPELQRQVRLRLRLHAGSRLCRLHARVHVELHLWTDGCLRHRLLVPTVGQPVLLLSAARDLWLPRVVQPVVRVELPVRAELRTLSLRLLDRPLLLVSPRGLVGPGRLSPRILPRLPSRLRRRLSRRLPRRSLHQGAVTQPLQPAG